MKSVLSLKQPNWQPSCFGLPVRSIRTILARLLAHRAKEICPSFRTASPKPSDWEFEDVGLNASIRQSYLWCRLILIKLNFYFTLTWLQIFDESDAKNQEIRKCPSHTHMTPLKCRCIKGWGHVRDIYYPSRLPHFFLFEPSRQVSVSLLSLCNVSECDPKCEGNVRDFRSPSRPSNALHIRVWSLWCEYVRVKMTFPDLGWRLATSNYIMSCFAMTQR